jgi:glycosyltransferase involved in cell wall biosynthesis
VQTLHEYKLVCPVYTLISNGRPCEACKGHHFYQALPRRCNRGTLTRTAVSVLESYVSYWCGAWSEIDHFIAVSDFQRNKIIQFGMPEDKISTIQNFVDASDIPPNQDPGAYLLYFGRIERVKGLFTLLEAIAPLTTIPLKIVGEGNAGVEVEDYVNDRNLKHVKIMGFQSGKQLHELIHNCMVVIVPSEWYETFGLTVLEAFAHGRPVIASTIGALPELVNDGEDGLLFPPGDVLALREKILWASKNSDLLVKMGQFGRKKVETLFTAERYYRELISIYRRILG